MAHVLRMCEEFVAASAGVIDVSAPSKQLPYVFPLLALATELRLERTVKLCSEKLAALPSKKALPCLTEQWIAGASLEATRAVLMAIKTYRT